MEPAWAQQFWNLRLEACRKALEKNNFEPYVVQNTGEARSVFLEQIFPALPVKTASWGDSLTMHQTGILAYLKEHTTLEIIETFAQDVPRPELIERRRQALLCDLFLTGSNAVTLNGELVNLDMVGNRVGGITFGPRFVVLLVGRNKIVKDVTEAMWRITNHAAPLNAAKHEGWKTPCRKTSFCLDNHPEVISEKSYQNKSDQPGPGFIRGEPGKEPACGKGIDGTQV